MQSSQRKKLGVIAGSGLFPFFVFKEAQRQGYTCIIAAIKGETDPRLQKEKGKLEWFDTDEILKIPSFLKRNGVKEVVFAGKINHSWLLAKEKLSASMRSLLKRVEDRSPTNVIKLAIAHLNKQGIEARNSIPFIRSHFYKPGVLTSRQPSREEGEDIELGWKIAKRLADMDVGQTVVIKDKTVVALEGMEGTDEAIKRGGGLAGRGAVIVKVARSKQDVLIDLPAIGLETVKSMVDAGCSTLCYEGEKMPFFQKEESIALADENDISIISKEGKNHG